VRRKKGSNQKKEKTGPQKNRDGGGKRKTSKTAESTPKGIKLASGERPWAQRDGVKEGKDTWKRAKVFEQKRGVKFETLGAQHEKSKQGGESGNGRRGKQKRKKKSEERGKKHFAKYTRKHTEIHKGDQGRQRPNQS